MTLDQILARITTPEPLSPAETRLRQSMIQSALDERTCRTCQSLENVTSMLKSKAIVGFLCSRCGLRWGRS